MLDQCFHLYKHRFVYALDLSMEVQLLELRLQILTMVSYLENHLHRLLQDFHQHLCRLI